MKFAAVSTTRTGRRRISCHRRTSDAARRCSARSLYSRPLRRTTSAACRCAVGSLCSSSIGAHRRHLRHCRVPLLTDQLVPSHRRRCLLHPCAPHRPSLIWLVPPTPPARLPPTASLLLHCAPAPLHLRRASVSLLRATAAPHQHRSSSPYALCAVCLLLLLYGEVSKPWKTTLTVRTRT
ncbi:hypothetical protein U1Q18_023989 [Sarracenia purpurea var. burkii]